MRHVPTCTVLESITPTTGEMKTQLLEALKVIIDPDLGRDIVTLGFIKEVEFVPVEGDPQLFDACFQVELTTPACPVKETFREDCARIAQSLTFVRYANIEMTAQTPRGVAEPEMTELAKIGAVIAVASCKGGVGKSTVAVNLAYTLAARGARVGLFDADIYGPSLPTMVKPATEQVFFEDNRVLPLQHGGVSLMSFGYINPNAAVMRGPMVAGVMKQLLTTTSWGELDYLLVDMPPGTGDIQLTLCQTLQFAGAVVVTTPQKLALVDVIKGIEMFQKVKVSCAAVVENMAYFRAPDSGSQHFLFGQGNGERLRERFGEIGCVVGVPIEPSLSDCMGEPHVVKYPDSESAIRFNELADGVVREVARIQHGGMDGLEVTFDEPSGDVLVAKKGWETEHRIWSPTLRRACRCALCIDEMTGRPLLDPTTVREDVRPKKIEKVGNYAVQIDWSDGHESLYPFARLVEMRAQAIQEPSTVPPT